MAHSMLANMSHYKMRLVNNVVNNLVNMLAYLYASNQQFVNRAVYVSMCLYIGSKHVGWVIVNTNSVNNVC